MTENIYDHVTETMAKLDIEDKQQFMKDFWEDMDREEKIVFTIDALESFERNGTLKGFVRDVNEHIAEKQDVIMDEYIQQQISKEEFFEKIKKVKQIETKNHRKE